MLRISQVAFALILGCCAANLSGCSRSDNSLGSQTAAQQSGALAPVPETKPIGDLPSRSLDDLKNAMLVAYVNKDADLLQKLMYPDRIGPEEKAALLDTAREHWQRPIEDVSDEPMIEGAGLDSVVNGQRREGNLKPLGFIRIGLGKSTDANQMSNPAGILHPYGVKDGAYYLATAVRAK